MELKHVLPAEPDREAAVAGACAFATALLSLTLHSMSWKWVHGADGTVSCASFQVPHWSQTEKQLQLLIFFIFFPFFSPSANQQSQCADIMVKPMEVYVQPILTVWL